MNLWLLAFALMCAVFDLSNANAKSKKKQLKVQKLMSIQYGSPSWNTNAASVDSAFLIIRDRGTGKLVQVNLEETAPDSSVFRGNFNVDLGDERLAPEVFIPPENLRQNTDNNRELYAMIQSGKLKRTAVLKKHDENGQPILDLYDDPKQARKALQAYKEELKLVKLQAQLTKQSGNEKSEDYATKIKALELEASKREIMRRQMAQLEAQKLALRKARFRSSPVPEQERRRKQASKVATQAMTHYQNSEYAKAEQKFLAAAELDPENADYYFRYGITQYRLDKFNEALVTLRVSDVEEAQKMEKIYYEGLIHYRLQELEAAARKFEMAGKSKDPTLGPSAIFYLGVIRFSQEQYEVAKKAFEDVLDTSQDPRMDEQAESYLDRIATAMIFKKMRDNKWGLTGTLGFMYDSNVLLSSDSAIDQGTASGEGDYRVLTAAGLEYRPVFSQKHEWSTKVDVSLTNSFDDANAAGDPYLYDLNLPYAYKSSLGSKAWKLTLKPGYELLYMDYDDSGTKKLSFASYWLNIDNSLIVTPRWITNFTLEYRNDDSHTTDSVGSNDADAPKYTAKAGQTFLLGENKKKILLFGLGYIKNAAVGGNKEYNRMEGGLTFVRPVFWSMNWSSSLNMYKVDYPNSDNDRADTNTALGLGLSKPLKPWVTWGLNGSYTKNDSSVTSNTYTKWLVMTTLSFNTRF